MGVSTRRTERLSYISIPGGAFLEWLQTVELPGILAPETARARIACCGKFPANREFFAI
jgi:hypothetical protein